MSDDQERPLLRVVSGNPSDEELAALTAVVAALSSGRRRRRVTPVGGWASYAPLTPTGTGNRCNPAPASGGHWQGSRDPGQCLRLTGALLSNGGRTLPRDPLTTVF